MSRSKQRYAPTGERLVVGCVPYRWNSGVLEILLIANQKDNGWILPKGGWETDESAEEGAARETKEEAGAVGFVKTYLGDWDILSSKQKKSVMSLFSLEVESELDKYDDCGRRRKQWLPHAEALALCDRQEMKEAIGIVVDAELHKERN